ncbi:MAG: response regulator [Desulfuromonadales bacterium]|nr:response regulator [Desulfuromonadales bacterium]
MERPKILVLDAYPRGLPIPEGINRGILAALKEKGFSVADVFIENLDLARTPTSDYRISIVNLLRHKLADKRVEIVITNGALATEFMAKEGKDLFPDATVLALISPNYQILSPAYVRVMNIPWQVDPAGTLDVALDLFPETRQVFVVTGANDRILPFLDEAKEAFGSREGKLNFEYSNKMTHEEMLQRVASLPKNTIVIYSPFFSDSTGRTFVPAEVVVNVCKVANSPVFATLEEYLGSGIVGGSLLRTEDVGENAVKIALDYLSGQLKLTEPVTTFATSHWVAFDWRELTRWKVDHLPRPEDSIIINRPQTLWGQYKIPIIVAMITFLFLTALLIALLLLNRRLQRTKDEAIESKERFRLLVENAPDAIFVRNKECFTFLNNAALTLLGANSAEDLLGTPIIERYHLKSRGEILKRMTLLNEERKAAPLTQSVCLQLDGTEIDVESTAVPINFQGVEGALVFMRNITDRVEEEKRRQHLEEQLHQAQKIESIGQLAGGIAHDYNNMLSVIIGRTELAQMRIHKPESLHNDLDQILQAAIRSRNITQQLLAFARKQIIAPRVLDLNETVESMLTMLKQLLGENIDLVWQPKKGLWPVELDPSQMDQILANLCINARDAIADIGKMTIETDRVSFDQAYCHDHAGFIPGDYVMLAVSDNGCGMDKKTLDKIFEPFFTTKGLGNGTGLGLSMVYGVVKQHNGFINVYSEPGEGTTFRIYLPRYTGQIAEECEAVGGELLKGQGETVLVVEDEASILTLIEEMLSDFGYKVLTANSPSEALDLASAHQCEIHLLITDVVMPEMNGRVLAGRLQLKHPQLKCLYMSGYTANVIAHHGVLDKGIHFIQKPFSRIDFSIHIRKALGFNA